MVNLRALDGRLRESEVGKSLTNPVTAVTMATNPKSEGVSRRANTCEISETSSWVPCETAINAPPRTDRPFRSVVRCSVLRLSKQPSFC